MSGDGLYGFGDTGIEKAIIGFGNWLYPSHSRYDRPYLAQFSDWAAGHAAGSSVHMNQTSGFGLTGATPTRPSVSQFGGATPQPKRPNPYSAHEEQRESKWTAHSDEGALVPYYGAGARAVHLPIRNTLPSSMYARKARYGRTKTYARRGASKATMRAVAKSVVRRAVEVKVLAQYNGNYSSVDNAGTTIFVNTSGPYSPTAVGVLLNAPKNGTAFYERIGRRIREVSLEIRGVVVTSATASTGSDCVRIIVVRDMDGTGTAPVLADMLTQGTTLKNDMAPWRPEVYQRFKPLFDACVPLNVSYAAQSLTHPFTIKCKVGRVLDFESSISSYAGDQASLKVGGIYLFAVSDTAANQPSVSAGYVFKFRDA